MAKAKVYKFGAADEPAFHDDFDVLQKAVLQVTDIKSNHNKYYAIELHQGTGKAADGVLPFRVFTHYGRTDDLENNPGAGARETRYFASRVEAEVSYQQIYRQKTGASKGYKEVSLASSRIGSHKSHGNSSGQIDEKTLERIEGEKERRAARPPSDLVPGIQTLVRYVRYLYDEATNALTSVLTSVTVTRTPTVPTVPTVTSSNEVTRTPKAYSQSKTSVTTVTTQQ